MKSFIRTYNFTFLFVAVFSMYLVSSCTPEDEVFRIGQVPAASFSITPVAGKTNTFLATNTTPDAFMFQWDTGSGFKPGSATDSLYFEKKGDYTVKLRAFGPNGNSTTEQIVTVAEDDPDGCSGNKKLLTGCDTKTWVLMPEAGALVIGPPSGDPWWSNNQSDVTDASRTCLFNDEYTFKADGSFLFRDLGDMRVDDEGGQPWPTDIGLDIGCYPMSQIPEKYQAWGSGDFTFETSATSLTVSGTGAHFGLYKVGENGTTAVPEETITYEILLLTADKLVVRKLYDWGQWKFTLVPKQ